MLAGWGRNLGWWMGSRAEVATLASPEAAEGGSDGPGADGGGPGGGVDARGAGWGITAGLDPEMALLAEHLLRPLPADKQIETGPFLEAVSHLPPFFDCLGSPVFTPIKADISGNITKIKAVYDTNPTKFRTLQNILEVEKEMYGAEWPKVGATLALMWLKRGLRFIQVFLQSICDGERDENHPNLIRVNATKAYEMALKKYHGWIVQKIFQAALYAAPYKSDFLKALSKGQNVTEEECLEKVRLFLVNYTATIDVIYEMYTRMNAELNYKLINGFLWFSVAALGVPPPLRLRADLLQVPRVPVGGAVSREPLPRERRVPDACPHLLELQPAPKACPTDVLGVASKGYVRSPI
ncbi:hypothetical protein R6Z07F_015223 [Ovis aries]